MIKSHIDVCSALQESAARSYSNLVTRPTGAAVRAYIERQILQAEEECTIAVLDFTHVGMMDFSCADEIVAKLVMREDPRPPQLVFSGLTESHLEAIDTVLERHGMSLVSHEGDGNSYVVAYTH
jgi:hypothetical protein